MSIEGSSPVVLRGDFRPDFTSENAREAFDSIADWAMQIVEIIRANPQGLACAALSKVNVLARMTGLEADSTADVAGADLNKVWGITFSPREAEAQALAETWISKAKKS
ncbi:hypothetical protein [Variovorax paradoxus]|uniref:hypothetical protein n=1 Tax=Variovorax paradoxus TaxID=34073 RepID=UPI002782EF13|nr:hypothetical protein [Variovorax paradoxus]MDQ0590987.1 hypothetical protein [Variovorax paradoxus]